MHYNFQKDILEGKKAEAEAALLLQKRFNVPAADILSHDTNAYDLKILSLNLSFEVKNDDMAARTGNIAIEYESRGKPSGLMVTQANFWIQKFGGVFVMVPVARLKDELLVRRNLFRDFSVPGGGDAGSNTKMYLVRATIFRTWGEQLS